MVSVVLGVGVSCVCVFWPGLSVRFFSCVIDHGLRNAEITKNFLKFIHVFSFTIFGVLIRE